MQQPGVPCPRASRRAGGTAKNGWFSRAAPLARCPDQRSLQPSCWQGWIAHSCAQALSSWRVCTAALRRSPLELRESCRGWDHRPAGKARPCIPEVGAAPPQQLRRAGIGQSAAAIVTWQWCDRPSWALQVAKLLAGAFPQAFSSFQRAWGRTLGWSRIQAHQSPQSDPRNSGLAAMLRQGFAASVAALGRPAACSEAVGRALAGSSKARNGGPGQPPLLRCRWRRQCRCRPVPRSAQTSLAMCSALTCPHPFP